MLTFFPPIVQILGGVAVLVAGVVMHIVILGVIGGLSLVVGGARWLRGQRGSGAGR